MLFTWFVKNLFCKKHPLLGSSSTRRQSMKIQQIQLSHFTWAMMAAALVELLKLALDLLI
jgi:hypothetical protein